MIDSSLCVGILGGGQLGRMMAIAAHRIGIKTLIFDPHRDSPAGQVSKQIIANFDDVEALKKFADHVDYVTIEFENLPIKTLKMIEDFGVLCAPYSNILAIAQNRILEKKFFNDCHIKTPRWFHVKDGIQDLPPNFPFPAILKTCSMGYDGKGQIQVETKAQINEAWKKLKYVESVLEEKINFNGELSVIVARNKHGIACFEPTTNVHKDGILRRSYVPSNHPHHVLEQARQKTLKIAEKLDLRGLITVEYFVIGDQLFANEFAPRPHNSGHWSLDGASPCQFEMALRSTINWPLPSPQRWTDVEMRNLIGDEVQQIEKYLDMANALIHLYGKNEIKEGRKMGHINLLKPYNSKNK
ncbi:MAG: 5-(carboxyamino)imidazole ribonucleotide synthase [Pseudomonadota bacterium]